MDSGLIDSADSAGRKKMMTDQDFYEFQTTVESSAVSFENQEDGSTVVACADGVLLHVSPEGESQIIQAVENT